MASIIVMDANAYKAARRLNAASGYLELGLPALAHRELDHVEAGGPFETAAAFLRGHAYCLQERFNEAVKPFEIAAESLPTPMDRHAWWLVTQCLQHAGKPDQALLAFARARGAMPWQSDDDHGDDGATDAELPPSELN